VFDGFIALIFGMLHLIGTIAETLKNDTYFVDKLSKEIITGVGAIMAAYFLFRIAAHMRTRLLQEYGAGIGAPLEGVAGASAPTSNADAATESEPA
jgi:hypothetical protein